MPNFQSNSLRNRFLIKYSKIRELLPSKKGGQKHAVLSPVQYPRLEHVELGHAKEEYINDMSKSHKLSSICTKCS